MKNPTCCFLSQSILLFCFLTIPITRSIAQDFQRVYGSSLDNSFSKVIKDGAAYYVLGQHETSEGAPMTGTVTRLDANGILQWTLSSNIACIFNDAVLTPSGDLLVVGSTLPFNAASKSLIGLVTSSGGGNFTWLRSYLEPGTTKNTFTRIVKNSTPQNAAFPYYILGMQSKLGQAGNDVVILNLNSTGTFNWKKKFESSLDNDFARDLELFSGGQMILAGNNRIGGNIGTSVIFIVDNTGTMLTGVQIPSPAGTFTDVATKDAGDIYATLTTLANKAHVMKFSSDLGLTWAGEIPQLTAANQIWEGQPEDAYLTGRGTFGGISRGVVVMMTDIGSSLTANLLKYMNTGTSFNNGSSWLMPNGQLAFTDGRNISAGFGQDDAFISLSDLQFNTCQVSEANVDVSTLSPLPEGPILPLTFFQEIPVGTDLTNFQALNWEQAEVCNSTPCTADFTFQINCGVVTFTDMSNVTGTPSWQWSFPGGTPSSSTSQNPVVTYHGCDSYDVCLTTTGTGAGSSCSMTTCHTVLIDDTTPPIAVCLGVGIILDANCIGVITPQLIDGGSSDDCLISSMSVSPNMVTGCGLFPVILTVTDWCGNTATCTTIVQAHEDIPPMIRCPSNVTVTAASPTPCSKVVNNLQPTNVSDNCSTPTVIYSITGATTASGLNNVSGLTFNQGVSTVTYTAIDACGNTTTCSFTVTVQCETVPSLVHCGQAVITCFSGFNTPANYWSGVNINGPVMALIDVRDHSTATPGTWWTQASASEYADPSWTPQNLGQVFGIAIDQNEDIYVAASSIYTCSTTSPFAYNPFTASGPGAIYKVSGTTGLIIGNITNTGPFTPGGISIPNNGSALGDIGYDAAHNQLFATNHADGMIYRIKNGLVVSRFDPFGSINPPASGPGGNPDFVVRGERTWGVAYYNNRVYFATWTEDTGRPNSLAANEIWSIGLNGVGEFAATSGSLPTAWADGEVLEIAIPTLPTSTFSNPVSDIAFAADGKMLLAERTMGTDCGGAFSQSWYSYAHSSRLLEYFFNTVTSQWELT
ncbi:MAG: HYR domain-containing protein, partial [Saprospiraceae bacterium]